MTNAGIVGASVPRLEGRAKVTGQARYVDDMKLPGMLYGAAVRSRIPRGKIKRITFGQGIDWNEFVIVSAADIPGKNCITLIDDDQPCLSDGVVNHPEEPLLLLAHPDRQLLPTAVDSVTVEYQSLPAIFNMAESETLAQIIWGADNTFILSSPANMQPERRNNSISKITE
jgi:CO/xanthine dehydrogenase Mo-binding subunit